MDMSEAEVAMVISGMADDIADVTADIATIVGDEVANEDEMDVAIDIDPETAGGF
ncbi:MAG: hypothetical protein M1821_002532 [Bathelium mastoideum]|nr:MAG: hypothetical protein M1821_002532 [Bathelium mastoideum]